MAWADDDDLVKSIKRPMMKYNGKGWEYELWELWKKNTKIIKN